MSNQQTPVQPNTALKTLARHATNWLFAPSAQVTEPGARKQAQLLASLTLFFALLNLTGVFISSRVRGANTSALIILGTLAVIIFISYIISRTRYYGWSAVLLLSIWTMATIGYAYSGQTTRGPLFALLSFMPLGFILGSAILPLRQLFIFVVINLAGLFLLPMLHPETAVREFSTTAGVLVCLGGLALIAQYHRNNIENERLQALQIANQELLLLHKELEESNQALEARVQARTAELEAFSYTVSHDLRAPLRAMNGYATLFSEDFSAELQPEAREYLNKISAAGNKMAQLIDSLLAFSRLGRDQLHKQTVDLNRIVRSAIESILPETTDRQIEWTLAALPPAAVDPTLIQQVFTNLISNAIKYSRKRSPAQIEIGSFQQNGQSVYFIRDNGAGFEMKHADKLFGVFQRLHREDEFEGTGIGLATVQRIITRHGGRIWAEAEPDKGATFYFTLPI